MEIFTSGFMLLFKNFQIWESFEFMVSVRGIQPLCMLATMSICI